LLYHSDKSRLTSLPGDDITVLGFLHQFGVSGDLQLAVGIDGASLSPFSIIYNSQNTDQPYWEYFSTRLSKSDSPTNHTITVKVQEASGSQKFSFSAFLFSPNFDTLGQMPALPDLSPSTSASGSVSASVVGATSAPSDSASASASTSSKPHGAVIGGAVAGSLVGVLLLIAAAYSYFRFVYLRRRSRSVHADTNDKGKRFQSTFVQSRALIHSLGHKGAPVIEPFMADSLYQTDEHGNGIKPIMPFTKSYQDASPPSTTNIFSEKAPPSLSDRQASPRPSQSDNRSPPREGESSSSLPFSAGPGSSSLTTGETAFLRSRSLDNTGSGSSQHRPTPPASPPLRPSTASPPPRAGTPGSSGRPLPPPPPGAAPPIIRSDSQRQQNTSDSQAQQPYSPVPTTSASGMPSRQRMMAMIENLNFQLQSIRGAADPTSQGGGEDGERSDRVTLPPPAYS
jgi:hypothetical protein